MSGNPTHRKDLARALNAQTRMGYRRALNKVTAAAEQGLLPKCFDDAGVAEALRILTHLPDAPISPVSATTSAATEKPRVVPLVRLGGPFAGVPGVPPICDLCDREINTDAGESWWMVTAYGVTWPAAKGIACADHDPASLPTTIPAVSGPDGPWNLTDVALRSGPHFQALTAPFGGWPDCVACGHRFIENEPRWMIEMAGQGWPNNTAAVCSAHHPSGSIDPTVALAACRYCRSDGNGPYNDGWVCDCDAYCGSLHCSHEPQPTSAATAAAESERPADFGDVPDGYCPACKTGYLSNRLADASEECVRCGAPRRPAPRKPTGGREPLGYDDLRTGRLVQISANEVVKVSSVYPTMVRVQIVYPVPQRTSVRTYLREDVKGWTTVSDRLYARYERAWGFRK